jgi:hypothetical protein
MFADGLPSRLPSISPSITWFKFALINIEQTVWNKAFFISVILCTLRVSSMLENRFCSMAIAGWVYRMSATNQKQQLFFGFQLDFFSLQYTLYVGKRTWLVRRSLKKKCPGQSICLHYSFIAAVCWR